MTALFIADLHLDDTRPQVTAAFFDFLQTRARSAQALYILGDLFEVWIGDDDDADLACRVREALQQLTDSGTRLYLRHGNRDFLLGQDFADATGATFLDQDNVVTLADGVPTLLMHGDSLCTRDTDYMAWREKARSPAFRQQMLALGLAERRALVADLRAQSVEANSNKAEDIMDVTPGEVVSVMRSAGVRRLIHGHTHRPAVHDLTIDGEPAQRIVLGDWHDAFHFAIADTDGCRLQRQPISG